MTSRVKWLIVGPLLTVTSFIIFSTTLGTSWGILTGALSVPLMGMGMGLWGYGWIEKVDIPEKVSSWMNSDT